MTFETALEFRWADALSWIQYDQLSQLRDFINSYGATKSKDEGHLRRLSYLLRSAARGDSDKCVQYLASELGGDIHHATNDQAATTLALAIYCNAKNRRVAMFKALMGLADANTIDELSASWTMALRAALRIGDDEILSDLAAFIGPRRFAEWICSISEDGGLDAWRFAAYGGNFKNVGILLAIPEMKARFEQARAPNGHGLAEFARKIGMFDFARDLLCLVAVDLERQSLENSCPAAKDDPRGPSLRM